MIEDTHYLSIAEYRHNKLIKWHDLNVNNAIETINYLAHRKGSIYGFSFRDPKNPNAAYHTALTLEYSSTELAGLANAISDFPQALFLIPTRSGRTDCHLMVIPFTASEAEEALTARKTRRASHLIAQYLARPDLTPHSESPSHKFQFRPSLPPHYRAGPILDIDQMLAASEGMTTKVKSFYRK